jgi:hypothetical protein
LRKVANALPGLRLAGLVLALTRRIGLACVVGLGLEALVYVVSALKFKNLGAPLMPADFLMVGQLDTGGGELLAGYLPHSPWPWLAIAGYVILVVLLAVFEPPLIRRRWVVRGPVAAVLVAALVTLLVGWSAWTVVYDGGRLGLKPWSPENTAKHTGLVSSLLLYHLQYRSDNAKPDVPAALAMMSSLDAAVSKRGQAIAARAGAGCVRRAAA